MQAEWVLVDSVRQRTRFVPRLRHSSTPPARVGASRLGRRPGRAGLRLAILILLVATVVVGTPTPARAAAWDIDWISETPFFGRQDSIAWDVAVQPDGGQIEVGEYGGDAFVLRYDPRLGRTEGFEGAGIAVLDAGGDERAYGVALQPDGAVVVAGQADGDVALWRLRPDGVSDGEFGSEGMARVDLGTDDDAAHAVAVLPDGRIVVAGWNGSDLALVRFTSVGALDPSFGSGGRVVTDLGSEEWAEAMAVTSTGSVVVAGGKGEDSLVARFSSDGTLDPTFGSGGTLVVDIGDADVARDVTLDAAEQPVLAGVTGARAYVARLTTAGAFDPTFAGDGSVETELRGTPAEANGVVALADGRIVIAGRTGNDAAIAAFLPTGLPDPNFSDGNAAWSSVYGARDTVLYGLAVAVDGTLATAGWEPSHYAHRTLQPLAGRYRASGYVYSFGREQLDLERYERANDLVLQPDGRSLSVATIGQGGYDGGDIGVARHLPGGELDPSFGGDGTVILDYAPRADAGDGAEAVALQPDGKVLVAGSAACHTGVVRLLPDGSPDTSFDTDGWVRLDTDPGGSCRPAEDIAVAPDGDVLITVGLASGPVVMRLTPAGSVDTSWAHGGTAEVPDVIGIPSSLVVQADGSLLVAGDGAIGVARLQSSGDVDASFGVAGVARIDTGLQDVYVDELVVRPDGRILAAGGYYSGDYSFAVAQWSASGAPDAAFGGGDGWVTTDFYDLGSSSGGLGALAYGLVLLPDGRFVVAGEDVSDWAFARYLPDGSLDPSFGDGGRISLALHPHGRAPQAVVALGDGSLLAAGTIPDIDFGHLALAHLAPAPSPPPPTTTTPPPPPPSQPPSPPPPPPGAEHSGYWMVTTAGSVHAFGDASWLGDAGTATAVDIEPTPSGGGYWVVDSTGRVFPFGNASWRGRSPALAASETVTSLSRTATGNGYWLFTTGGRVFPYGDAVLLGDMSAKKLNGPVLDSIPTPSGNGYYMVASDGGIFSFGDARFHGSMGNARLNAPVQSLVPDPDGTGYWLVASDGGIFSFGAPFYGSMGSTRLNRPVTGMVGARSGYLMVGEDGGIFAFGDAPFRGSLGANPPPQPVVSVAVIP